jgi:vacuolar-type H+-ATPase subunit H
VDVQKKLDEITAMVSGARAMPMSASCVINRADLLALLEEVRAALPDSLAQAREVIGDREQMVAEARQEAERIIESAHAERGSLISDTEVARRSRAEADRILGEARQEAEEIRAEADEYVDSKLANFEVVLTKTLGSVGRGREKLLGTGPGVDAEGYEDEDAPERSHDPETLRRTADAYVDAKLGAFEAVLAKTLDAVGRGREKLHGRIASDDLGSLADDTSTVQHSSDADYLAGLAELAAAPAGGQPRPAVPAQQSYEAREPYETPEPYEAPEPYETQDAYGYPPPPAAAPAADPYGYQQQYAQQDADGYQQADPYASYQGYDAEQPAYDAQQGYPEPPRHSPQPPALDETSLFDTSMISAEQLRQYEQQRYEQGH